MPRSVNVVAARRRRKKILKAARGYWGARSKVFTVAKNTYEKGLQYDYRDWQVKKHELREPWIQRINEGARPHGLAYSAFIVKLKWKIGRATWRERECKNRENQ